MQLIILYTGATTTHPDMMFTSRKECKQRNFVIVSKFFPKSLFCCYDSALSFFGLGLVSIYLSYAFCFIPLLELYRTSFRLLQ